MSSKAERKNFQSDGEASRVKALLDKFDTYVRVLQINGGINNIWNRMNTSSQQAIKALIMDIRSNRYVN
tara:strand:+ start:1029 stop:1235 length:207 start_codon:yes stop_codon:yes gene_type:complete